MMDMLGTSKKAYYADGKMLGFSGSYVARRSEPQFKTIIWRKVAATANRASAPTFTRRLAGCTPRAGGSLHLP